MRRRCWSWRLTRTNLNEDRGMPTKKDEILKLRVSKELKSQLEMIAESKGESLSVVVREALRRFIESVEDK